MLLKSWKWTRVLTVPLLVAIVTPAIGAGIERFSIYGWRDDAGVQHYTNELADVPEAYRNRVATLVKDWGPPETTPEDAAGQTTEDTAQTTQASPTPVQASSEPAQANVTDYVDASQNSSVVQNTQVVTQQPVLFDDTLLPEGGRASFARTERPSRDVFQAAGPIPQDVAGPPALGSAGPPPLGSAGPPPLGAAGRPPIGFAARRR
jgi:hypothetical protein